LPFLCGWNVTGKLLVTHPDIERERNTQQAFRSQTRRTAMIANKETGTRVDEVAAGIYRISSPLNVIPGGFTFNSYLIDDDEPLLFHAGYRKLFPLTLEAIQKIMPAEKLRWIGGSHFEGDEFGALNDLLAVAPAATPFGSEIGALTSLNDFATRPARGFVDGEEFSIGSRRMKWIYTPHVPHGWDCGILFDLSSETLFCGDLFTQPGSHMAPVTESEVLTASETMRGMMDYYAHAASTAAIFERLASLQPSLLACQHGSAYRGDGAGLLRELSATIERGHEKSSSAPSIMSA
jgi:flavorubredoxin